MINKNIFRGYDIRGVYPTDLNEEAAELIGAGFASMMKRKELTSKCGIKMLSDCLIEEVNLEDFDFLFIPGGPGSFKILANIKEVDDVIDYFVNNNKLVAAICAAPCAFARAGLTRARAT